MRPDAKHRAFQHSGNNRDNTGRDSYKIVRKDGFNEESPNKERMRKHYGTWGRSRRLYDYKFIKNFLIGSVGRRWDDVYSDVCRFIDVRTPGAREIHEDILGWQVHIHTKIIDGKVYATNTRRWYRGGELQDKDLYVDDKGILCQYKKKRPKYVPYKPLVKYPITHTAFGDFLQMDGLWYRVKMVEPKFYEQEKDTGWYKYKEQYTRIKDVILSNTKERSIFDWSRSIYGYTKSELIATYGEPKVCVSKLAANKSEIKRLNKYGKGNSK